MIETILRYTFDLDRGVAREAIRPALLSMDDQAHTFRIAVRRSGEPSDLVGGSVRGYFVRADGATVALDGSVDGSDALLTLSSACYHVPGRFQLVVKLTMSGAVSTVFYGDGSVSLSQTDALVDNDHVVPSLDELLALIDDAEAAASSANTAASAASAAATNAQQQAQAASAAASHANAAAAATTQVKEQAQAVLATMENIDGELKKRDRAVNILVNSQFEVARCGYGGYMGGKRYAAEMWWNEYSDYGTFAAAHPGVKVTYSGNHAYMTQHIPNIAQYAGKMLTFAVMTVEHGLLICPSAAFSASEITSGVTSSDGALNLQLYQDGVRIIRLLEGSTTVRWAALYEGAYTAETLPAYVPKGYANELEACQREYKLPVYNLLDNSDFSNPVNQRNLWTAAAYRYSMDRWLASKDAVTITRTNGGITTSAYILQYVESSRMTAGKTYTIAVYLSSGGIVTVSFAYQTPTGTYVNFVTESKSGVTIQAANSSKSLPYIVLLASVAVRAIALYEGAYTAATAPAYVPKGYTEELAECQRYYQMIYTQTYCYSKGYSMGFMLPKTMRIAPTAENSVISDGPKTLVSDDVTASITSGKEIQYFYCDDMVSGTVYYIECVLNADL